MHLIIKKVFTFLRSEVVSSAHIGQQASVLTLATLFTLVPLVSALIWFMSLFPSNQAFLFDLFNSFLSQLIPEQAITWRTRMDVWGAEVAELKTFSLVLLFGSLLFLVNRVDRALHLVFQVDDRRSKRRWLHYLWVMPALMLVLVFCMTMIVLIQIVLGTGLGSSLPWLSWGSTLALWVLLVGIYQFSSRNTISLKANIVIALGVTLVLFTLKLVFAWLYVALPNWSIIFGVFSAVPLFLLWCQMAWAILLYGALFVRWSGQLP